MKKLILLSLLSLALGAQAWAAGAADPTTCQVHGGALVLQDNPDFNALTGTIDKAAFAALPQTSKKRAAICQSRKLARIVKGCAANYNSCKITEADLLQYYKDFSVLYFGDSEVDDLIAAQNKVTALVMIGGGQVPVKSS